MYSELRKKNPNKLIANHWKCTNIYYIKDEIIKKIIKQMINEENNNERKYQRERNAAYLIKANTQKRKKAEKKLFTTRITLT